MLNAISAPSTQTSKVNSERFVQQMTSWALVPMSPAASYFLNDLANWWLFAVLAIVSTLNNPRALIIITGLISVHHLSLSVVLPQLIFPETTVATNLQRTMLHAAIVLLEATVLLMSLPRRAQSEADLVKERKISNSRSKIAQEAEKMRTRAREMPRVPRKVPYN